MYYGLHADINECTEGTDACEDVCENIIGSYRCSCSHQGYRLQTDGTNCQSKWIYNIMLVYTLQWAKLLKRFCCYAIDINECTEGTHNCAQNCTDTDGSYVCSCNPGYRLANNSHQCDG